MSQRGSKLLQDVISLSLADRQALIEEVLASIDDDTWLARGGSSPDWTIEEVLASIDDDTLKAELKRRRDEYLADKSCSVPWRTILEDDKASSL